MGCIQPQSTVIIPDMINIPLRLADLPSVSYLLGNIGNASTVPENPKKFRSTACSVHKAPV